MPASSPLAAPLKPLGDFSTVDGDTVATVADLANVSPVWVGRRVHVQDEDKIYRRLTDGTWVPHDGGKGDKGIQGLQGPPGAYIRAVLSADQVLDGGVATPQVVLFDTAARSTAGALAFDQGRLIMPGDLDAIDCTVKLAYNVTTPNLGGTLRARIVHEEAGGDKLIGPWSDVKDLTTAGSDDVLVFFETDGVLAGEKLRLEVEIDSSGIGDAEVTITSDSIAPQVGTRFALRALTALGSPLNPANISILGGVGLSGGGDLSADRELQLNLSTIEATGIPEDPDLIVYRSLANSAEKTLAFDRFRAIVTGLRSVDDIAALRQIDSENLIDGEMVYVSHHTQTQSKGGGFFLWVAAANDGHDNGVVIQPQVGPASAGNGRWMRRAALAGDVTHTAWFGVKGDNSSSDSAAITAAISYSNANKTSLWFDTTVSQAKIDQTLLLSMSNLHIHFEHVTLIAIGAKTDFLQVTHRGAANDNYGDRVLDDTFNIPLMANVHTMIDVSQSVDVRMTGQLTVHNGGIDGLACVGNTTDTFVTGIQWPWHLIIKGGGDTGMMSPRTPGSTFHILEFRDIPKHAAILEPADLDGAVINHLRFAGNCGSMRLNSTHITVHDLYDRSASAAVGIYLRRSTLRITGVAYGESQGAQANVDGREALVVVEEGGCLYGHFKYAGSAGARYSSGALVLVEGYTCDVGISYHFRSFVQVSTLQNVILLNAPNTYNQRLFEADGNTPYAGGVQPVPNRRIEVTLFGTQLAANPVGYYDYDAAKDHDHTNDNIEVKQGDGTYIHKVGAGTVTPYRFMPVEENIQPDGTSHDQWRALRGIAVIERNFDADAQLFLQTLDAEATGMPFEHNHFQLKQSGIAVGDVAAYAIAPTRDSVGRTITLSAHADSPNGFDLTGWTQYGTGNNGLSRFVFPDGSPVLINLAPGDNKMVTFECVPWNHQGASLYVWLLKSIVTSTYNP